MSEATQTEKKQAQKERKAYRAKKRKLFFKTLFSRKIVLVSAIVVLLIILIAIFDIIFRQSSFNRGYYRVYIIEFSIGVSKYRITHIQITPN